MAQKKSKIAKVFIFITLIFIVFASFAVYIVMYAGIANTNKNPCEEGYILNTETGECEEETTNTDEENIENIDNTVIDNEESCTQAGGTWYKENGICILGDENNVTEDSQEQIGKVTEENPEDIATTEIPEENAELTDE